MSVESQHWSLDKRIPVTLLLTILINIGTVIWFAAKTDARISYLETQVDVVKEEQKLLRDASTVQAITLGRIEENIKYVKEFLEK